MLAGTVAAQDQPAEAAPRPAEAPAAAPPPSQPAAGANPLIRSLLQEAVAREHGEAGFLRDAAKAAELYCRAARMGNAEALYSLGWMLANGRGLPQDEIAAGTLFRLAAAQGYSHAQALLDRFPVSEQRLPPCMTDTAVAAPVPAPRDAKPPSPAAAALSAAVQAARRKEEAKRREAEILAIVNELPPQKRRIANMIRWLAPEYSIDTRLALALVRQESGFDPAARSPKDAMGVMQLIPATAERFNVRNIYDPIDNIRGGLSYMRWLLAYYRGRVPLMLAAYNAGEGAVDRYGGLPPFLETHDYVRRIRAMFPDEEHPFDEKVAGPSPLLARNPGVR